jgi:hypothetical protein
MGAWDRVSEMASDAWSSLMDEESEVVRPNVVQAAPEVVDGPSAVDELAGLCDQLPAPGVRAWPSEEPARPARGLRAPPRRVAEAPVASAEDGPVANVSAGPMSGAYGEERAEEVLDATTSVLTPLAKTVTGINLWPGEAIAEGLGLDGAGADDHSPLGDVGHILGEGLTYLLRDPIDVAKYAAGTGLQFLSDELFGVADPLMDMVDDPDFQKGRRLGHLGTIAHGTWEVASGLTLLSSAIVFSGAGAGLIAGSGGTLTIPVGGVVIAVDAAAVAVAGGLIVHGAATTVHAMGALRGGGGGSYQPPPKEGLPGFPDAKRVPPKTGNGSGKLRARWQDNKTGEILEWDYQHGTVEKYDKRGNHLGEFDMHGKQTKPAVKGRKTNT